MIKRVKSIPTKLHKLIGEIPRSKSFHDFNNLYLSGNTLYTSYGMFLVKYPNASRSQRKRTITEFYKNKI